MAFCALEQRKKRIEQRRREEEKRLKEAERKIRRTFARSMIVKANESPDASVEELVAEVTFEMERAERN